MLDMSYSIIALFFIPSFFPKCFNFYKIVTIFYSFI